MALADRRKHLVALHFSGGVPKGHESEDLTRQDFQPLKQQAP